MARWLAGVALGAMFLAALLLATRKETAAECELCIEYRGRTACRTALAADRDAALRSAVSTACAVLSSGVTQGMECDRTPPRMVRCSD
jgi:hypothetical protein